MANENVYIAFEIIKALIDAVSFVSFAYCSCQI